MPIASSCPFMSFGIDPQIAQRILSVAMERGADFADLYFANERQTSLRLEDGIIARAGTQHHCGVGVRAVSGDRVGYAYSESLEMGPMLKAARVAASIASSGAKLPTQELKTQAVPERYRIARRWGEVRIEERLPILKKAEVYARASDPAVEKVSVNWADSEEQVLIVTSEGMFCSDYRPSANLQVQVTALKDGQRQSFIKTISKRAGIEYFTDEQIRELCRQAVAQTLFLFEARRPPAGEMPVVLAAGASGILLHEAIGHGLEADFNRKGTSIYATLLGKRVAPNFVTVVDDGTVEHDRGAVNVDDEGQPAGKTVLIEHGILRGYLHDRISASHYGVRPTGSGRRQSFRHVPLPRMRSTYMLDGPHGYDEIIGAVKKGIVAETFTNGQVQIGAGDYTFYIRTGWMIEDGKRTYPIKDVNIIGNGPETLKRIEMAAGDARLDASGWMCGKDGQGVAVSLGIPTVLVNKLTVGGLNEV